MPLITRTKEGAANFGPWENVVRVLILVWFVLYTLNAIPDVHPMVGRIAGKVNKVIAAELGLSHKTVEYHRKNVMEKLGVGSVPELVKLVLSKQSRPAGTPPGSPPST